ncbi:MAG: hypothetical protein IIX41_01060 [Bacteroidales bacterium]|nr:hypothetical protein [Bacteroidales bacterium]
MKKLLSLVLICVMGFGMISCVESEESQSVTELRNAKAEQLKALVNLYNAQAEAARITAQAEAALKAAQAAYEQAQADYTAEQLDQLKKKFELQLESLIAEYESKIAQYNYNKANYEKMLMDKLAEIEAAEKANLIALYNKYSQYSDALNTANTNLIQNKVNLAKVEAEIVTVKEAAEAAIAEQEEIIAEKEALIAAQEAKLAVYQDYEYAGMNIDSLELEVVKANMAWREAKTAYDKNEGKAVVEAKDVAMDAAETMVQEIADMDNTGKDLIQENQDINNNVIAEDWVHGVPNSWSSTMNPYISIYVNETNLDSWKKEVLKTNLDDAVATATENLEKAEAVLETFQGFKADFEKAAEAREAILAYKEVYSKYQYYIEVNPGEWVLPTVKYYEAKLKEVVAAQDTASKKLNVKKATAQLDTLKKVDLAKFTAEDYGEWNMSFWYLYYDMDQSMKAFRSKLVALEAEQDDLKAAKKDLETAQKALETAQKALAALTEEATEAEVEAAENAVEAAQDDVKAKTEAVETAEKDVKAAEEAVKTAYDKVVYEAEIVLISVEKALADAEKAIAEAEEDIVEAKENEAALLAAYPAAKAAVETLEEMFGEDSDFDKFWFRRENNSAYFVNGFAGTMKFGKESFNSNGPQQFSLYLLADANEDGNPDMWQNPDGTAVDGGYKVSTVFYADFAVLWSDSKGDYYDGVNYDFLETHYTTKVAVAKDALTTANNSLAKANEWKTNWDAKEKELRDFVAAKNEEIKDVQALQDAYYAAVEAAEKANDAVTELKGKFNAVSELLTLAKGGYYVEGQNVANLIAACERAIADAESAIAAAESTIKTHMSKLDGTASWTQTVQYKETLVAGYKATIEKYTAEVELYTKLVEDAKTALDAALSASDAE